jgi:hypothetical protein
LIDKITNSISSGLSKQLKKYEIAIQGIARSLSGAPSTPWHITIGNPLRPIFCAGDMYMDQDLALDLGPTLAFNDLPSNIKATFTLTNARPWGLQEIAEKFNAGSIRVVTTVKDANDLNHGETLKDQIYVTPKTGTEINPTNTNVANVAGATGGAGVVSAASTTPTTNPQVPATVATVAAGPQLPPVPTLANNFNTDLPVPGTTNLTAGAATNLANAQSGLSSVTAAVNSGQDQAAALAAKASAAATAAATAAGTATGGLFNGAIAGAVATAQNAAQNATTTVQNGVATVGANISSIAASAAGTVKESVNSESIVADANSTIGTTLQNIDLGAFAL